jgi:hypothetical protein
MSDVDEEVEKASTSFVEVFVKITSMRASSRSDNECGQDG